MNDGVVIRHNHRGMISDDRLMKAYVSGRKVPEGELCAVCSDLATGYHYGVASCNGW